MYLLPDEELLALAEKIRYKQTPQEDMYLYLLRPDGPRGGVNGGASGNGRPAIVYFTGGGWKNGRPTGMIANAAWFRDHGFIGISADYRVETRHGTSPVECVKDGRSAVRYLRTHARELGIDPTKIIAAGGSAGGHVALACVPEGNDEAGENLTISARPDALVLSNPVVGEGFRDDFFATHRVLSPIGNIQRGWPPTVLSCGTEDATTPFTAAEKFTRLMRAAGNACELIAVAGADHSCDWPVTNPTFLPTVGRMRAFLAEQGIEAE